MPTDDMHLTTRDDASPTNDIEVPPREILSWASAHWDDAATRLVGRLAAFAAGRRESVSGAEAFFIVHLCAEKRETRAFPLLCRLIAEDRDICDWLDDAVTETLPGILIRVFDGDAAPLRQAIEAEQGDEFARASALAALGYLVRSRGAMTDEAMRAFLRRIRRDMPPRRESVLWMIWASTTASLGFGGMRDEVSSLRREGFIPDGDFSRADFDERVALARSDASGLAGFLHDLVAPLDDAASAIMTLAGPHTLLDGQRLWELAARRTPNGH